MNKKLIRWLTALIVVKSVRRRTRKRLNVWCMQHEFAAQQKAIGRKIAMLRNARRTVRVGFFVVSDNCFQTEKIFRFMLDDPLFDPRIVVIPDVCHGEENQRSCMERTLRTLRAAYGDRVLSSERGGVYADMAAEFDICSTCNPYQGLTLKQYTIEDMAARGIPVFFAKYFHRAGDIWEKHIYAELPLGSMWLYFADAESELERFHEFNACKSTANVKITGCLKVDGFADFQERKRERKRVIIAPHHTVSDACELKIGNFLNYSDFFLSLPLRYPQIDWVFRPHPLLMTNLVAYNLWTREAVDEYLRKMSAYSNVEYQVGGNYDDTFVNSDGMIQDCGSFLPEYFYVGKPQCYILESKARELQQYGWSAYGRDLLEHTYRAYAERDVVDFIENVILEGKDVMKDERQSWFERTLCTNYPNASKMAYEIIKSQIFDERT